MEFKKIRFKNFLSFGNKFTEFKLDTNETILITGGNGVGKCLDKFTVIDLEIPHNLIEIFEKSYKTSRGN